MGEDRILAGEIGLSVGTLFQMARERGDQALMNEVDHLFEKLEQLFDSFGEEQ